MLLVYGSFAINHWFSDFRKPCDFDIICSNIETYAKDIEQLNRSSLRIDTHFNDDLLFLTEFNKNETIASPDLLLTIKMSHAMYDINWFKTIKDIVFLQNKGAKVNEQVYELLQQFWKKQHKGLRPKLNFNQQASTFFNEHVSRIYNHDELHQILKYKDVPMYQKILVDNTSVKCDENKFNALSEEDKKLVVIEEVLVLATERYVLKGNMHPRVAKNNMMRYFVTGMTSGWFNRYILDNIEYFMNFNDPKVFDKMVKCFDNSKYHKDDAL